MSKSQFNRSLKKISVDQPSNARLDGLNTLMSRRRRLPSVVGLLLIAFVTLSTSPGCTPQTVATEKVAATEAIEAPEQDLEPSAEAGVQGPVQFGDASIEYVESISEDETSGQILTVQVTNPTTGEIVVTIPCGLIFDPGPESDEQRLMVIQEASASLLPGEEATLTPYVICIDSSNAIPESGSTYHVGVMATGDLLKLAQCICKETLVDIEMDPLAFMDQFGLQFAVWTVSDGLSFEEMFEGMEEAGGALGEISAEDFTEEMEELFGGVMEIFQGVGQDWLERCQIEINP
ncbi:MAG: hypothetical protein AMJ88_10890 [Anaerolineae bacterium SM23_ 63]|nr:MAG: hypothetical protein AMJ88_10890 [Anaerolineae bacterium SM23_ 63]HEY46623.1 hypothetical protein [Anaerolineae bacterium]